MADRTGRAMGSLEPVIYFQNSAGHILLPPVEIGKGPALAKQLYEDKFKHQGYQWMEAGTLNEVQSLQKKLVDQEQRQLDRMGNADYARRQYVKQRIHGDLRQRMASSDCDPWERDFIAEWLKLSESKQEHYTKLFTQRNQYLWALEMDNSTKLEDRMGS